MLRPLKCNAASPRLYWIWRNGWRMVGLMNDLDISPVFLVGWIGEIGAYTGYFRMPEANTRYYLPICALRPSDGTRFVENQPLRETGGMR